MKNNNEGHFVSKIGNKKEERLELFDKKIKETFKKKMFEGISFNE